MRVRRRVLYLTLGLALWGCTKSDTILPRGAIQIQETPTINVFYFHRTIRCPSCEMIETLARDAVEEGFPDELASGKIIWRAINVDEPENAYFEDDYRLQMQSVIISEVRGGKEVRWKNLEKVWDLLKDETGFVRYVQDEIRAFERGS